MKVRKRKTKETNRPIFSKKSINEPNELNTSAVEIPMYAPNMPTRPLHPVNPDNARHLRITAAAGT